jgi:hypothetical protein
MQKLRVEIDWGFFTLILMVLVSFSSIASAEEPTESPVPDAWVARAQFTTDVVNREPVDQLVTVDGSYDSIYYFTDLRNLQGRTVTHRWEHNGWVASEVPFNVGGPRWRVYSRKSLKPNMPGKWTVVVVDESGWPLHASIFEYLPQQSAEQPPQEQDDQEVNF